jgi:hypothetical protein
MEDCSQNNIAVQDEGVYTRLIIFCCFALFNYLTYNPGPIPKSKLQLEKGLFFVIIASIQHLVAMVTYNAIVGFYRICIVGSYIVLLKLMPVLAPLGYVLYSRCYELEINSMAVICLFLLNVRVGFFHGKNIHKYFGLEKAIKHWKMFFNL